MPSLWAADAVLREAGDLPPTRADTDWRVVGAEAALKGAHLWHPKEDAWLKGNRNLSASERARKDMDMHIQRSHAAELRDLCGPTVSEPLLPDVCDAKSLCAWVVRSMPPLPWPENAGHDNDFRAFLARRPNPPLSGWIPPLNGGCHHPDDHVIVAAPRSPVQEDGRCFLRSTPTFFRPRVGHSQAPRIRALLDNCANLCLANKAFILQSVPGISVYDDFTTGVDGIGSARTVGYVHLPIYVDCMSRVGGKTGKVELNLEVHLMETLSVDLVIGMDAICAYGIDTIVSRSVATLVVNGCDLAFPIEFRRLKGARDPSSCDGFPVVCSTTLVVPPMHEGPVSVVSGLRGLRGDAWLHPIHVKNDNRLWSPLDGGCVAPGPIQADQSCVLFANLSSRPLRLRRGQVIGHTTLCGTSDRLCFTALTHFLIKSPVSPATIFSCVPKRGVTSLTPGPVSASLPPPGSFPSAASRPAPATLLDPHNRDPPVSTSSPGTLFDISDAYGRPGSPPACISTLLSSRMAAFSFDGRPGVVDSVRIPIHTDDSKLFASPPRHVGPHKRQVIDASISQLLEWDVIEPSTSRVGYPVVLVHQHDKWRFCVDYRSLNVATIGEVYPMTCSDAIFDTLHGKRVFSILDAARGYHQLPIAETDRWKTAFITHRGLFQFKRMPFGLRNAPLQFQRFMDSVLGSLRWTAALVYIDDILVFSADIDSHATHLRTLLDSAISVGLRFNPSKCHFAYPSLKVLGHRVSTDGLSVLEDRAAAIRELATPRTLKELWHVLGIFGYYRQYIPKFAIIAAPLTRLTKGTRFQKLPDGTWQPREISSTSSGKTALDGWGPAQDEAFSSLKEALSTPPTLAFPDFSLPFIVYVDASHDGMAACLHQPFLPVGELPDVARTVGPSTSPGTVQPARSSGLVTVDAALPVGPHGLVTTGAPRIVGPSGLVTTSAHPSFSFDFAEEELNELRADLQNDRVFSHVYQQLTDGVPPISDRFELVNGLLYWRLRDGRLATCIPASMVRRVLTAGHESFGHWGFEKTWSFIKQRFYRPGLSEEVREYVRSCPDCQRVKASRQHKLGRMSSHELPGAAFRTVSMDVMLGLPVSWGLDACMVIVDHFSKAIILRPTLSTATARDCGSVFFDALVSRGFLPTRLITDRDPRFVSDFWTELMSRLRVDCKLISAYHQQADPAERYIQTIQTLLRLYVADDEWVDCLPFVELVVNNTPNSSTGFSPNQLMFIDPPDPLPTLCGSLPSDLPDVADRLASAHARVEQARDHLDVASRVQKRHYDSKHIHRPLAAGDRVFVLLDDHPVHSLVRGMNKLKDNKWGPFRILEMVGHQAARLDLPPSSQVHPVISILHLQPYIDDRFGRVCKPPPVDTIEGDPAWEVEYIFGERIRGRDQHTEFKVKWVGYPDREFTWEPEDNLRRDLGPVASSLIESYRAKQSAAVRVAATMDARTTNNGRSDRPVYFISRVLKSYEENYTILELEMAAMVWAILKFQRYLDGSIFTVVTDHQSLLTITGSSSTTLYSARVDKWRMLLSPYLGQMSLVHRAGKVHGNADGLSRSRRVALS